MTYRAGGLLPSHGYLFTYFPGPLSYLRQISHLADVLYALGAVQWEYLFCQGAGLQTARISLLPDRPLRFEPRSNSLEALAGDPGAFCR